MDEAKITSPKEFYNRVINNNISDVIYIDLKNKAYVFNINNMNIIWVFEPKPFITKNKWNTFIHLFKDKDYKISSISKEQFIEQFKPLLRREKLLKIKDGNNKT